MVDGEVLELRIAWLAGGLTRGLTRARARRQVIVAVIGERKVAGAHRLAKHAQADSFLGIKEHLQEFAALRRSELLRNQPGGGIGKRSAESVNLLVCVGVVDLDGERRDSGRAELEWRFFQKRLVQVLRGFDDVDVNGALGLRGRRALYGFPRLRGTG